MNDLRLLEKNINEGMSSDELAFLAAVVGMPLSSLKSATALAAEGHTVALVMS